MKWLAPTMRFLAVVLLLAPWQAAAEDPRFGIATNAELQFSDDVTGIRLRGESSHVLSNMSQRDHNASSTAADDVGDKRGEEHDKEGEEEGEEEEHPTVPDLSTSFCLIIFVVYSMCSLGLVTTKNLSLERKTMRVLNMKLSIFLAVLIFNGQWLRAIISQVGPSVIMSLQRPVLAEHSDLWRSLGIAAALFVIMQGVLYKLRDKEDEGRDLRAAAQLTGHIVGFAYISFFSQFWGTFNLSGLQIFWSAGLSLFLIYYVWRLAREMLDKHRWSQLYEDVVEETENDSCALCGSFLLTQWLRYLVTDLSLEELDQGVPGQESLESYVHYLEKHNMTVGVHAKVSGLTVLKHDHAHLDAFLLIGAGFIVFLCAVVFTNLANNTLPRKLRKVRRALKIARIIGSMCIAWTIFYAMVWSQDYFFKKFIGKPVQFLIPSSTSCMATIGYASASVFIGYSYLYLIHHCTLPGSCLHQFSEPLVHTMGLLIGFSWEKAFDLAIEKVTEEFTLAFKSKEIGAIIQMVFLLVVVVSTALFWRRTIFPEIIVYSREEEDKEEMKDAAEEAAGEITPAARQGYQLLGPKRTFAEFADKELKKLDDYCMTAKSSLHKLKEGGAEGRYDQSTCLIHMRRIVRHVEQAQDHDYEVDMS